MTQKHIFNCIEWEKDACFIAKSAFNGIDKNLCTLYVPCGMKPVYRRHELFGEFNNIEMGGWKLPLS